MLASVIVNVSIF